MSGTVIQELPRALEISEQQLLSWISSSGKKVVGCPCFNFSDWVRNKNSLVGGTPDALNTLLPSRSCCFLRQVDKSPDNLIQISTVEPVLHRRVRKMKQ